MATVGNLGTIRSLRRLLVGLRASHAGVATLQSLLWLRFARQLDAVQVDLRGCRELCGGDMRELQALCTVRHLRLRLEHNESLTPAVLLVLCRALGRPESRLLTLHVHASCPMTIALAAVACAEPRLHLHLPLQL